MLAGLVWVGCVERDCVELVVAHHRKCSAGVDHCLRCFCGEPLLGAAIDKVAYEHRSPCRVCEAAVGVLVAEVCEQLDEFGAHSVDVTNDVETFFSCVLHLAPVCLSPYGFPATCKQLSQRRRFCQWSSLTARSTDLSRPPDRTVFHRHAIRVRLLGCWSQIHASDGRSIGGCAHTVHHLGKRQGLWPTALGGGELAELDVGEASAGPQ